MTDNLAIWNQFADIDPAFTKAITGKAYKGTSPNPQYVIRCLTELFGPVGKGFGWEVMQEGFLPLGDEILHWCRIRFWHGERANWFESYGQTKALMKTRNGLMSDEDAPKKSLTDAIIKAASHLGIAANIFLGRWDDQKYVQDVADSYREKDSGGEPTTKPASKADARPIYAGLEKQLRLCTTKAEIRDWLTSPETKKLRLRLPADWDARLRQEAGDFGKALPDGHSPDDAEFPGDRPSGSNGNSYLDNVGAM